MKALYESSPEEAAKVVASHRGDYGKAGGWIYNRRNRAICHGWSRYAQRLMFQAAIVPKEVTDPRTGKLVVRWAINWPRV